MRRCISLKCSVPSLTSLQTLPQTQVFPRSCCIWSRMSLHVPAETHLPWHLSQFSLHHLSPCCLSCPCHMTASDLSETQRQSCHMSPLNPSSAGLSSRTRQRMPSWVISGLTHPLPQPCVPHIPLLTTHGLLNSDFIPPCLPMAFLTVWLYPLISSSPCGPQCPNPRDTRSPLALPMAPGNHLMVSIASWHFIFHAHRHLSISPMRLGDPSHQRLQLIPMQLLSRATRDKTPNLCMLQSPPL